MEDAIFEKYIDAITLYESGLNTAAKFIYEDLLQDCVDFKTQTGSYHPKHINVIEQTTKVYLATKSFDSLLNLYETALNIDPENIRILQKLFYYYTDYVPNEKSALLTFLKASKVIEKTGGFHPDYLIFKEFRPKGEAIEKKRRNNEFLSIENQEMSSISRQSLMGNLPTEILIHIFKRLDVKSLINLVCVCKGWRFTILESPQLVSLFSFRRALSFESLQSYLRLFDNKVPISEIVWSNINIITYDKKKDAKLFKLLLTSGLQSRSLIFNIAISNDTNIAKIIKDFNSPFFANLVELHLKIGINEDYSDFLNLFLPTVTNLISLRITSLNRSGKNKDLKNLNLKNKILFPFLEELNLINFDDRKCFPIYSFLSNIELPNLHTLKFSITDQRNLFQILESVNGIKRLELNGSSVARFIKNFLVKNNGSYKRLINIETLIFINCPHEEDIPTARDFNILPNLKTLIFHNLMEGNRIIKIFQKACSSTLTKLHILAGSEFLFNTSISNRTNANKFSLKDTLLGFPKLSNFKLQSPRITVDIFSTMMYELAMLSETIKLKYFEISNPRLMAQQYLLLFLSMKDKLLIDTLKLPIANIPEIEFFANQLKANKVVKTILFQNDDVKDSDYVEIKNPQ
jgi:hypothetical protein